MLTDHWMAAPLQAKMELVKRSKKLNTHLKLMVQLVKLSLPMPEIHSSYPNSGKKIGNFQASVTLKLKLKFPF